MCRDALDRLERIGDRQGASVVHWTVTRVLYRLGELHIARIHAEKSLEIRHSDGDYAVESILKTLERWNSEAQNTAGEIGMDDDTEC